MTMLTLNVEFDDQSFSVEVPGSLVVEAKDYFSKLDGDMDKGWQMSRWWVPDPDSTQRCQIVADKLLDAIRQNDTQYCSLLCAYVLRSKPETRRISINTEGEIQGNEFFAE